MVRIQNTIDSVNTKQPQGFIHQNKPDTPGAVVCLCCPSSAVKPPLFLVKRHNKLFVLDSLSRINPGWFQNIEVVKEPSQTAQYGDSAKDGIVIITLNEDHYPGIYKMLKHNLKRFRPVSN
ncbi:MAG: hypothetical protein ACHQHN_14935 [Sphingobacteriales bacterium]